METFPLYLLPSPSHSPSLSQSEVLSAIHRGRVHEGTVELEREHMLGLEGGRAAGFINAAVITAEASLFSFAVDLFPSTFTYLAGPISHPTWLFTHWPKPFDFASSTFHC